MGFSFKGLASPSQDKSWKETITDRIQNGKVLPIISNSFTDDLAFRSHRALVDGWADYVEYPLIEQQYELPQITQYENINKAGEGQSGDELQIKERYLEFLKQALLYLAQEDPDISDDFQVELKSQAQELSVSQLAKKLNYPNLESWQTNPLLLLAELPLPIYLTTSYHSFLEAALEKAGRDPQAEFCRWHPALESVPGVLGRDEDYTPTPQQPLVYHLFGMDRHPASLVLTEDDHLDFLAYISKHQSAIHSVVTKTLTMFSMVMIGYSLRDWDFRIVFRGVIKPRPAGLQLKNVAIQLRDTIFEKEFVKKYLRQANFEVVWCDSPHEFIRDLYEGYTR